MIFKKTENMQPGAKCQVREMLIIAFDFDPDWLKNQFVSFGWLPNVILHRVFFSLPLEKKAIRAESI